MDKIKSLDFFYAWIETVNNRKEYLLSIWKNTRIYTSYIKGDENCVIKEIADKLNLLCYTWDYYSIDALFFKTEDLVDQNKEGSYWLRDVRIAFEHENNFRGIYQEVAHLLLINADLKVLVTYPENNTINELNHLHEIISGNRQSESISNEESFLLIFGYESGFAWEGFVYKKDCWKKIKKKQI